MPKLLVHAFMPNFNLICVCCCPCGAKSHRKRQKHNFYQILQFWRFYTSPFHDPGQILHASVGRKCTLPRQFSHSKYCYITTHNCANMTDFLKFLGSCTHPHGRPSQTLHTTVQLWSTPTRKILPRSVYCVAVERQKTILRFFNLNILYLRHLAVWIQR